MAVDTQLLPALDTFDLGKLRESIRENGVQEPIVKDEFGYIIDGHHRKAIAEELGIACPERVVAGLTAEEKQELAIMLNAARRHLSLEQKRLFWRQRRTHIKAALVVAPERSDRAIADQVGVDHKTVAAVRDGLEENGEIPILERRGRAEPKEVAENFADHRNELFFSLTINYPCPNDEIRMRGADPYPKASERLDWSTGRQYLVAAAPRNQGEGEAMLVEAFQRAAHELASRPLKTMIRA